MCTCGICGKPFPSHTALAEHIFRDHANRMFAAIIAALVIALALLRPANALRAFILSESVQSLNILFGIFTLLFFLVFDLK